MKPLRHFPFGFELCFLSYIFFHFLHGKIIRDKKNIFRTSTTLTERISFRFFSLCKQIAKTFFCFFYPLIFKFFLSREKLPLDTNVIENKNTSWLIDWNERSETSHLKDCKEELLWGFNLLQMEPCGSGEY